MEVKEDEGGGVGASTRIFYLSSPSFLMAMKGEVEDDSLLWVFLTKLGDFCTAEGGLFIEEFLNSSAGSLLPPISLIYSNETSLPSISSPLIPSLFSADTCRHYSCNVVAWVRGWAPKLCYA